MKIRFTHVATARLVFQPGDEITVARTSPEIEALLGAERVDGVKVARLVVEDELAVVDAAADEVAVMPKWRARGQRPEGVAR